MADFIMEEVTRGYLVFLHDLVSAYHEKLCETLSPKVAETFRGTAVDSIVKKLGLPKELSEPHPVSTITELMKKHGLQVQMTEVGDELLCEMNCPVAHAVHPLLSSRHPQCPMATLMVGLLRVSEADSRLVSTTLTENGTNFRIARRRLEPSSHD